MKLKLSLEAEILAFICLLGFIRMLFAGAQFVMQGIPINEIIIAFGLLFLVTLLYVMYGKHTKIVTHIFCCLLLIFISYSWLRRDGLSSTSSCSIISIMIIFSALSKGRFLYFIIGLTFLTELILLYIWLYHPIGWFGDMTGFPNDNINYQMLIVLVSILVVYFALQFDTEYESTRERKKEVRDKIDELNQENRSIEIEQEKLKKLNKSLEQQIATRVGQLMKSNRKISKYLRITSLEMNPTVDQLKGQIEKLSRDSNSEYLVWLQQSASKLVDSFTKLKYDGE